MKKYILLFLFFLSCFFNTYSQRNYAPEVYIGGNAGVNLSKVRFTPTIQQNFLLGPRAGITFRYIEEKFFGFQVELNYSQQGWSEKFEGLPDTYTHTLSYIDLPFLTHIFFGNHKFRGFVNLGPRIGFCIGDSYKSSFDISTPPVTGASFQQTEQYTLEIKNIFEYGICGGAGIEFKAKKNTFVLEGRYSFGLSDIFGNRKKDNFSSSSNQCISVGIAYLLNIK